MNDEQIAELKRLHAQIANIKLGGIGGRIVNAFPALIAALEEAEAERDRWRIKCLIAQAKLEDMAIDCGQAEGQLKRCREEAAELRRKAGE